MHLRDQQSDGPEVPKSNLPNAWKGAKDGGGAFLKEGEALDLFPGAMAFVRLKFSLADASGR